MWAIESNCSLNRSTRRATHLHNNEQKHDRRYHGGYPSSLESRTPSPSTPAKHQTKTKIKQLSLPNSDVSHHCWVSVHKEWSSHPFKSIHSHFQTDFTTICCFTILCSLSTQCFFSCFQVFAICLVVALNTTCQAYYGLFHWSLKTLSLLEC